MKNQPPIDELHVVLTPSVVPTTLDDRHLLLLMPGIDPSRYQVDALVPRGLTWDEERDLTDKLSRAIEGDGEFRSDASLLSNDYYSYSIRPLFQLLVTLKEQVQERQPRTIVLHVAKRSSGGVPVFGFATRESRRGSRELFGAFCAQKIKRTFPDVAVVERNVRRDIFCYELFRRTVLKLIGLVLTCLFLVRQSFLEYLLGSVSCKNPESHSNSYAVIVRAEHQIRFAASLSAALEQAGVSVVFIALPQFTQGAVFRQSQRLCDALGAGRFVRVGIWRTLKAVFQTVFVDSRKLLGVKRRTFELCCGQVSLEFDIQDLVDELRLAVPLCVYENLLTSVFKDFGFKQVFSFELVGRMAAIEANAAGNAGVSLSAIQTAAIENRPHVVFPYQQLFFCDSRSSESPLQSIGSVKRGSVVYAGSPYESRLNQYNTAPERIVFYTQPYETEVTAAVIDALVEFCEKKRIQLAVRFHPRDCEGNYSFRSRISRRSRPYEIDGASNLNDSIALADLCVTRTSSVGKEAIAFGVPVLLCTWSEVDRGFDVDYLRACANTCCSCNDEDSMQKALNNYSGIVAATKEIRAGMFCGNGMTGIAEYAIGSTDA